MILLHVLQNRAFRFSLALLAKLEGGAVMDRAATEDLGRQYLVTDFYLEEVLSALQRGGFLSLQSANGNWTGCLCKYGRRLPMPQMPMSAVERDYLQYILRLPEAGLFLDEETRNALAGEPPAWQETIQWLRPQGNRSADPGPEDFRTVLEAIRTRRYLSYRYRTGSREAYAQVRCIPWKIEYSAYDRRWWGIFYLEDEDRTVKAVLAHLKDVTLGERHNVPQERILAAMEKLKMPEPVVLRVKNTRQALERCFLQFETQEFQQVNALGDGLYELSFTYYRFDREEILRKLMQLGPAVTLLGPQQLKADLRGLLRQALEMTRDKEVAQDPVL